MLTTHRTDSQETHRGECGSCGSSDGNVHYNDGHAYCYVCETYTPPDRRDNVVTPIPTAQNKDMSLSRGQFSAIDDRGISMEAAKAYGITTKEGKHIYPYYDDDGNHIANKVRYVATKDFHAEGRLSQATLFGQQLFRKGGKIITITEGELDAVSVYQMTGNKWPCVSIRRGAGSAVKDAKAQFEFLDSYDTIVICFDNDDVGREAAVSLAQIFEPNKCKIVNLKAKDASEYLKAGKTAEFVQRWWEA